MIRTVVIPETGEVVLPHEALEESRITAGSELVVISRTGQILLLDRQQLRHRIEEISQRMQEGLRLALSHAGKDSLFAGLSLQEYLALSEVEEEALWERLLSAAEGERTIREQEIPADFVPARQKRR